MVVTRPTIYETLVPRFCCNSLFSDAGLGLVAVDDVLQINQRHGLLLRALDLMPIL